EHHAVFAMNPLAEGHAPRVTWVAAAAPAGARLGAGDDRAACFGAAGTTSPPAALAADGAPAIAARSDADPAAILDVVLEIPAGETRTLAFLLGEETDLESAHARIAGLREPGAIEALL